MRQNTRTYKLALLTKIVEGRLTDKEVSDLRKSREPIQLTLNLGDDFAGAVNDPTYHIDIYTDRSKQSRQYWKYADGRIEEIG